MPRGEALGKSGAAGQNILGIKEELKLKLTLHFEINILLIPV